MTTTDRPSHVRVKRLPPYRLLLIDDDADVRDIAAGVFTEPMFVFATWDGPHGAINAARRFQPDVVLIDIQLPSFGGERVCGLVRPVCPPHAQFYAYSSSCEEVLRAIVRSRAMHGYFSKSTSPYDIRHQLERALAR